MRFNVFTHFPYTLTSFNVVMETNAHAREITQVKNVCFGLLLLKVNVAEDTSRSVLCVMCYDSKQ